MITFRRRLSAISLLAALLLSLAAAGCASRTSAGRTVLPGSNMVNGAGATGQAGRSRPLLSGENPNAASTFNSEPAQQGNR